jgi:hypothetical protein
LIAVDLGYDEGGAGDTLIVAVQIGIIEQSKKLKRQWKARLAAANDLKFFHSVDFGNYTGGVFTKAGLNRKERHELLKDLAKLIHCHLIAGISARVSISAYDRIIPKEHVFRARTGTAYGFLISECLNNAHALLDHLRIPSKLNIVIEGGHNNSQQAIQLLGELQKVPPERLPIPITILTAGLGNKTDDPILQAADMLAYCTWQRMLGDGDTDIWNALHKPGMRYRSIPIVCSEEDIRRFCTYREEAEKVNWYLKQMKREERDANKANIISETRPDATELVKVPHSEIKSKLDVEKAAKKRNGSTKKLRLE